MPELNDALANMICEIWKVLKAADTELEAYKNAVTDIIQTTNPGLAERLNVRVASERQSAALQSKINQKYVQVLETFLNGLPNGPAQTGRVLERLQKLENL
jgi:hypothetical protein